MTFTEILNRRRSIRRFTSQKIDRNLIDRLLKAAFTAPSSKNTRSTRFMVVENPDLLARIAEMRDFGSAFVKDAPLAIVVLGDTSATDLWVDNCAISATILQLAAVDEGLGSCWVHVNGRPRKREEPDGETATEWLREILPIPENWQPLCVIALGYPDGEIKPHSEKNDLEQVIRL